MSDQAITYPELPWATVDTLRAAHPEWEEEVFNSYELRIATFFKLLESSRPDGAAPAL